MCPARRTRTCGRSHSQAGPSAASRARPLFDANKRETGFEWISTCCERYRANTVRPVPAAVFRPNHIRRVLYETSVLYADLVDRARSSAGPNYATKSPGARDSAKHDANHTANQYPSRYEGGSGREHNPRRDEDI